MWLPEPVYERLPVAYIIMGMLFFAGTSYIGLSAEFAELYLVCGFFSTLAGFVIILRRRTERSQNTAQDTRTEVELL